jgi:hypothetical protein
MIRFTAIAVCVLFTLSATGQQRRYTVVLNDGSRIRGAIVADSADYLDLKILTPQVLRIGKSQVSSLEKLRYPIKNNLKSTGYYIRFSTSLLTGQSEEINRKNASIHLSNGYQFSNGLAVGIGSGIEELDLVLVPLYADIRYTPLSTGVSPYAWLRAGYSFATGDQGATVVEYSSLKRNSEGGFLFGTGAGISMFTWRKTAITLGIGYRYQRVIFRENLYWWGGNTIRETITHFNRLELQFGFTFM